MNIVIPPLIFYAVGAALVVGGTVRALTLGRRDQAREIADDDPAKARARRRHLTFGLVWIAMGLFLIASTAGVLRSKAGPREDGAPRVELTRVPTPTPPPKSETSNPVPLRSPPLPPREDREDRIGGASSSTSTPQPAKP
jgi:hypothetical protein